MYPENIHFCQFVVCLFLTKAAYVPQTAEACQTVKNVPLTMARCFTELTPAERFAIYDYVVDRGKATNKTPSIKLEDLQVNFEKKPNEDQERTPSHLEIKSKMRDYKRRRQSYRAKNVHITQKTYTEVLREVIENQTEYLGQLLKEDGESVAASERSTRMGSSSGGEVHVSPCVPKEPREQSAVLFKRTRSNSPDMESSSSHSRKERRYSPDSSTRHRSSNSHEHRKHHKSKHKHKHKSSRNGDD